MKRQDELDFLKCIFLLLMIVFHLEFVSTTFSYAKKIVYTFHMPGFLLISGYLFNSEKTTKDFLKMLLWLAVPYLIMESGYIVMSSKLGTFGHIEQLNCLVFLKTLFLNPIGPYWYLHTLIICFSVYYFISKWIRKPDIISIVITALVAFALSKVQVVNFSKAMYLLAGIAIRKSKIPFNRFFCPSWWSALILIPLLAFRSNLSSKTFGGVLIVYFVISLLLFIYSRLSEKTLRPLLKIGRNSLIVYLFSPIFTMLCKFLIPVFPSTWNAELRATLFTIIALPICIGGSFLVGKMFDITHLSKWVFGKEKVIS